MWAWPTPGWFVEASRRKCDLNFCSGRPPLSAVPLPCPGRFENIPWKDKYLKDANSKRIIICHLEPSLKVLNMMSVLMDKMLNNGPAIILLGRCYLTVCVPVDGVSVLITHFVHLRSINPKLFLTDRRRKERPVLSALLIFLPLKERDVSDDDFRLSSLFFFFGELMNQEIFSGVCLPNRSLFVCKQRIVYVGLEEVKSDAAPGVLLSEMTR
ncbi:hypothetical protein NPIL_459841 [Nephila pilipes]|uniref:Uncharacterized protein n=1 Tax=Nephila pilipes TaxID=299642 RepID=A0A8X6QUM0_NEPPI|nr:hypothetical protein NPIL_459841 [Nephila pilipes]